MNLNFPTTFKCTSNREMKVAEMFGMTRSFFIAGGS